MAAAREDLENASEARVNLAVLRAEGTLGEAQFREAVRRVDARAAEARERLADAEASVEAAEPLDQVVNRFEVDDETLHFVPSVGEPVEQKRTSVARGTKTRQANLARKRADERAA